MTVIIFIVVMPVANSPSSTAKPSSGNKPSTPTGQPQPAQASTSSNPQPASYSSGGTEYSKKDAYPATLAYPSLPPVSGDRKNYDGQASAPTGTIDYLCIQRMRTNYNASGSSGFFLNNLPSNELATKLSPHPTKLYLACPPNLDVAYSAHYDEVQFGAVGIAAGSMLAQNADSASITASLQSMANNQLPEFVFKTIAETTSSVSQALGQGGGNIDANTLAAVSQGKVFNPYLESVFRGMGFRTHQFDFKLVARNQKEAASIAQIIKYLKAGLLPRTSAQGDTVAGPAAGVANGVGTTSAGRYLLVPDKFQLAYKRLKPGGDTAGLDELPHYKFALCVLESMSVSYTPDGQYVAFKPEHTGGEQIFVPAVNMRLSFKETSFVAHEQAAEGY